MNVVILDAALDGIETGYEFYESQEEGLGQYFEDSIFADLYLLQIYAGIHRKVFEYHRLICKRFPFAVYYGVEGNEVFIRAVVDCRSKPERIQKKLR